MKTSKRRTRFLGVITLAIIAFGIIHLVDFTPSIFKGLDAETQTAGGNRARIGAMKSPAQGRKTHADNIRRTPDTHGDARRINITNFEHDEFDVAWAEALQAGGTEVDRVYNLSLVVARMSRIGDPGQILDKVLGQFGPGRSRCHLIGTLFMASDRVESLRKAYEKLEFPDELTAACSGISKNLCMLDSPEMIDLTNYAFLGDRLDDVLQKTLTLYVARFQSKSAEELSSAVRKAMVLQTSVESKRNLLSQLVNIAPFDCWAQLTANKLELPGPEQKKLLAQMFGRDAAKAMEQIASVEGSEQYLPAAFQQWLENDARRPIEWLEENNQALSLDKKESAMLGIATYSARQGDWNVARQWLEQITDPARRKVAEGQVWSMERDTVRREVSKNPELAIQSMISGDSRHQDYWLEEAVATWAGKEPAKAQDWYQQNWKTLPAGKSQYVAAAFATQATKQGDTATARQWAAHIQDAKTKQRIEAGIAKAEGPAGN